MAIFVENIGKVSEGSPVSWRSEDALLYALSIGVGRPDPTSALQFTTEGSAGSGQKVFPTFPVILGGGSGSMDEIGDFSLHQVLHGAQSITLHQELASSGSAIPRMFMSAVYDQGKNAAIELTTELTDYCGNTLATSVITMIIRGETGYGPRPAGDGGWISPQGEPDASYEQATGVDQALLYRLNGDRNPLHYDPVLAAKVGFERPILHGLCTFGMAANSLINTVEEISINGLGSISARFASPVIPGQTLTTKIWQTPQGANFQVFADGKIVLDRGVATAGGAQIPELSEQLDSVSA